MPAESVADWRRPPEPIRRPSTVDCIDRLPLRVSTTVPTGSDAWPFSGTKPDSACGERAARTRAA